MGDCVELTETVSQDSNNQAGEWRLDWILASWTHLEQHRAVQQLCGHAVDQQHANLHRPGQGHTWRGRQVVALQAGGEAQTDRQAQVHD